MDNAEKRAFWQQQLADWASSGISQKAYCAQHGLKLANFQYWRKRSRASENTHPKLIPVTVPPRATPIRLTVSGVHMEVPMDALEQLLPVLWRSLRAAP